MKAMNLGAAIVVSTTVFSCPLISLALTWLLLGQERITTRTALGCVAVVAGVVLVTLFQ